MEKIKLLSEINLYNGNPRSQNKPNIRATGGKGPKEKMALGQISGTKRRKGRR